MSQKNKLVSQQYFSTSKNRSCLNTPAGTHQNDLIGPVKFITIYSHIMYSYILKNTRIVYNGYMKTNKTKTSKQLERYFKGAANHRRISILLLVLKSPGISVEGISENLNCNFKTISEHTRRLVQAGLLNKNYMGNRVEHRVSPYGKMFCDFIRKF